MRKRKPRTPREYRIGISINPQALHLSARDVLDFVQDMLAWAMPPCKWDGISDRPEMGVRVACNYNLMQLCKHGQPFCSQFQSDTQDWAIAMKVRGMKPPAVFGVLHKEEDRPLKAEASSLILVMTHAAETPELHKEQWADMRWDEIQALELPLFNAFFSNVANQAVILNLQLGNPEYQRDGQLAITGSTEWLHNDVKKSMQHAGAVYNPTVNVLKV